MTVLVRESAQNSWDAKTSADVSFKLDLVTVSPAHRSTWKELLAPNAPNDPTAARTLSDLFRSSTIRYLAVSDRGTSGLGGPTRSDVEAKPNQRGWLSFVLNSGERQDVDGGGGTYGYGKGAFFLASRVGTVLIYTRFREGNQLRSRLIASALLSSTTVDGVPYTGRHWWGLPSLDHCEPLADQDADVTARRLGLPGFEKDETGTTVVVLDPDLSDPSLPDDDADEMSIESAGRYLADAAAWNLWPVTLADRAVRVHVSVSAHGVRVPVPSEHDDAVLANFAAAYRTALGEHGTALFCMRPKQKLGQFGHQDTFGAKVTSPAAAELGLVDSPHHVCLMRSPDLVVQYLPGPTKAHPDVGYAAVFKVNDDLDSIFSRSEPPTHDAWVDVQLTGRDATFVRMARKRMLEQCAAIVGPKTQSSQAVAVPVGTIAQRLGFLLSGVGGTGASDSNPAGGSTDFARSGHGSSTPTGGGSGAEAPKHGRGTTSTPRRQARPALVGSPFFASHAGRAVLVQKVRVSGPTTLRGSASVFTGEGSLETTRPAGGSVPEVLGWRLDGNVTLGEFVEVDEGPSEYELLVVPVVDAAVDVAVEAMPR
ncbi:hypothetical protein [Dactylosporangium fulvum]|uniref:Uncharacterized protein n=1 Tax=Dactylosporangium fulvum TaxID=53359 RepID=A0ABY5W1T8_9ACTN|nr:hypothetical protein [Dactylosporangium fulvum]UWP83071.1 hypothetical protein Dfulv_01820 [Dactylosporangium fulvum]